MLKAIASFFYYYFPEKITQEDVSKIKTSTNFKKCANLNVNNINFYFLL